jgi:hypothetical protein
VVGLDVQDLRALAYLLRTAREPLAIEPGDDDLRRIIDGYFTSKSDDVLGHSSSSDNRPKRTLLITEPDAGPVPFGLHDALVLRTTLDNEEAIRFALSQLAGARRQAPDVPGTYHRSKDASTERLRGGGSSRRRTSARCSRDVDAAWERFSTKAWVPSPPRRSGDPSSPV